jgi:hypothetical protein
MRHRAGTWILAGLLAVVPPDIRALWGGADTTVAEADPAAAPVGPDGTSVTRGVRTNRPAAAAGDSLERAGWLPAERFCPAAWNAADLLEAALTWLRCGAAWTAALPQMTGAAALFAGAPVVRTIARALAAHPLAAIISGGAIGSPCELSQDS